MKKATQVADEETRFLQLFAAVSTITRRQPVQLTIKAKNRNETMRFEQEYGFFTSYSLSLLLVVSEARFITIF